ncbi:MAG TPA: response regulator transcription factor [Niastella sp.]
MYNYLNERSKYRIKISCLVWVFIPRLWYFNIGKPYYFYDMINIAIIENDALVRNTLTALFQEQPDMQCIMAVQSAGLFLKKATADACPDIVLSDIGLPGIDGIETIALIKKQFPEAAIIMLSVYADNDRIFKALCAGAVGYLQKDTPLEDILHAVKVIQKGGSIMSPAIARKVVEYFEPCRTYNEPLTAKEQQVIAAMVDGLSCKTIAASPGITEESLRRHIKNIYRKLELNSKGEVIVKSPGGEI